MANAMKTTHAIREVIEIALLRAAATRISLGEASKPNSLDL